MNDAGYRALVGTLVPVRSSDGASAATPQPASEVVVSSRSTTPVAPRAGAPIGAGSQVLRGRWRSAGGALRARGQADGCRRHPPGSRSGTRLCREVSEPIGEVHFSVGGEQLLCQVEDTWTTLDLATRVQSSVFVGMERPVVLAAGQQEFAHTEIGLVWRTPDGKRGQVPLSVDRLVAVNDRVLALSDAVVHVLRVPDLSTVQELDDAVLGPVLDVAVDHRDETLYTLHPNGVRIWRRRDEGWGTRPGVTSRATLAPPTTALARLFAVDRGVLVLDGADLRPVTRDRPAVTELRVTDAPASEPPALFADPSRPAIVQWRRGRDNRRRRH